MVIHEETKTQKKEAICPRSISWQVAEPHLNLDRLAPELLEAENARALSFEILVWGGMFFCSPLKYSLLSLEVGKPESDIRESFKAHGSLRCLRNEIERRHRDPAVLSRLSQGLRNGGPLLSSSTMLLYTGQNKKHLWLVNKVHLAFSSTALQLMLDDRQFSSTGSASIRRGSTAEQKGHGPWEKAVLDLNPGSATFQLHGPWPFI